MARRAASPEPATLDASMRVVILKGPERFLVDEYTRRLVAALEAEHGEIDQFDFDGQTTEPAVILDELRSYGLLQQHKLVVVDQADKLLASRDDDAGSRKTGRRQLFERYAENPVDSATLLLRAETWRPGRIDKAVAKVGAVIDCKPPDARKSVGWCVARCRKTHGIDLAPDAAELLVERIGPDLLRLDTELAKLAAFVAGERPIDRADVAELVGMSREDTVWTLQAPLAAGDADGAVRKLRELLRVAQQPEVLITWAMIDLVRKMSVAAMLTKDGMPAGAIAKELKLWGPDRDAILRIANRVEPARLAQLLRSAIDGDRRTKRGIGRPARTLEVLAVEIADTVRCA